VLIDLPGLGLSRFVYAFGINHQVFKRSGQRELAAPPGSPKLQFAAGWCRPAFRAWLIDVPERIVARIFGDPVRIMYPRGPGGTCRTFAPRPGADQSCIRGPRGLSVAQPWWGLSPARAPPGSCAHLSDARDK